MTTTLRLGPYTQGEKPPPVELTFTEEDEVTPINLTGFSAKFQWRETGTEQADATTVDADITGAAAGEVTYDWGDGGTDDVGTFIAQFWVGNGTNRYASKRIEYTVQESVGVAPNI